MCGYSTFPRLCNTTKVQLRTALNEFATCVVDLLVIGWMLVVQLFQEFSPTAAAALPINLQLVRPEPSCNQSNFQRHLNIWLRTLFLTSNNVPEEKIIDFIWRNTHQHISTTYKIHQMHQLQLQLSQATKNK